MPTPIIHRWDAAFFQLFGVEHCFPLLVDQVASSIDQEPFAVDKTPVVVKDLIRLLGKFKLDACAWVLSSLELLEITEQRERVKVVPFEEERCW